MRIGIYNRYWTTFGGGEKHVASVAQTLTSHPGVQVVLIGVEPFSLQELEKRFHIDLSGCCTVVWPNDTCQALAPRSADYDIFINSTYCSSLPSHARRSIYFCFFPHPLASVESPREMRSAAASDSPVLLPIAGYYPIEPDGSCWFRGNGVLAVSFAGAMPSMLRVPIRGTRHAAITAVRANHQPLPWKINRDFLVIDLRDMQSSAGDGIELFITSTTFCPAALGLSNDPRELGFCIKLPPATAGLQRDSGFVSWLATYDTVIANSEYTAGWIRRRWNRQAVVLPPAIDTTVFRPPPAGAVRRPIILSVGRFFAGSHNKKHDFLIGTFRKLIDTGALPPGWELHLVGGRHREFPHHIEYYHNLLRLAEGYPVRFFPDLPFPDLLAKYREASLYWHAAGVDECEESAPDRFEHFGVTTCEALACGLIPIVINRAGQKEIVRDGINGFTFLHESELVAKTLRTIALLGTPEIARFRAQGQATVQRYSSHQLRTSVLRMLHMQEPTSIASPAHAVSRFFRRLRPAESTSLLAIQS